MFVAGVIALVIGLTWSRSTRLPGDGGPLWIACAAFIAMSLFFGQREHFGERVRVLRWLLLCAVATPLAVAGFAMGSLFSL